MKHTKLLSIFLTTTLTLSAVPAFGASAAVTSSFSAQSAQTTVQKAANATQAGRTAVGWVKKGNVWYFYNAAGVKQTGWANINNKWYYFNSNGVMLTGLQKISGKQYLLASNGVMQTGWQKLNGSWYYFGTNGAMTTGWQKVNKKWYYLGSNGVMQTGWQKINGNWYYFGTNGAMYAGPHCYKINNTYYFFQSNGALVSSEGWQRSDQDNRFYVYSNGTVATSTTIGNYTVNANGTTVLKTNNKMDKKAQGYSSGSQYLILANLSTHKLCIYQGSKGNWKRIKGQWNFTSGASSTKTPTGVFKLTSKNSGKYGWKNFALCRAAYVYHTSGGFMLHTILLSFGSKNKNPKNASVVDGRLGYNLSKSCLRLSVDHEGWIFNNCPRNTGLVVYK